MVRKNEDSIKECRKCITLCVKEKVVFRIWEFDIEYGFHRLHLILTEGRYYIYYC